MSKFNLPRNLGKTGISMQATGQQLDLYLFGVIGDWWDGNTAEQVLYQLQNNRDVTEITVYLSSVGGYFADGLPIYNLLKQHPANVTVVVMGYALSMASVIMLAGGKVKVAQNALLMIHNAQGCACGSPVDLRQSAEILTKHEQAIIPLYASRLGKKPAEIQALLDNETWFTAQEALDAGLVDEIIDPVDLSQIDKQQPSNAWEFAVKNFKHPPSSFAQRVESAASHDHGWVKKILNRVVGDPPPANPTLPDDEVEMKPEEIEAAVNAALEKRDQQATATAQAELADLKAKLAQAEKERDEATGKLTAVTAERDKHAAELAELAKEVPGTIVPINTGPAGSSQYLY